MKIEIEVQPSTVPWNLQDEMLVALRMAQATFITLSRDKTIYQKVKEAWQRVSIAIAAAEVV